MMGPAIFLTEAMKEQKRLSEIIKQKDDELIRLHEQLAIFQKMLFGRKSEKPSSSEGQSD